MSQNDSESDIWEYKSLRKVKKQDAFGPKNKPVTVINGSTISNKSSGRGKIKSQEKTKGEAGCKTDELPKAQSQQEKYLGVLTSPTLDATAVEYGNRSRNSEKEQPLAGREEFCPGCQMPFSVLLVQSQRWHVSECLDMIGVDREECPDGFKCSSTIPSHYRKYSHYLLAHSRATNDKASLSTDSSQEIVTNDLTPSSQNPSSSQSPSPSPCQGGLSQTSTPAGTNAFMLLKSPSSRDIRKKKGWSSIAKQQKSTSLEQGGGVKLLPMETGSASGTLLEDSKKADRCSSSQSVVPSSLSSSTNSDEISYSPISTLPTRKSPSHSSMTGSEEGAGGGDSVMLYSDVLTQAEMEGIRQSGNRTAAVNSDSMEACFTLSSPCGDELNDDSAASTSLALPDEALNEDTTPALTCSVSGLKQESAAVGCSDHTRPNNGKLQLRSPQSLVLERLREQLSGAACADPEASSGPPKEDGAACEAMLSVTLGSPRQARASVTPRKARGKAGGSASCGLKQTDIGVFFGLKPLKLEAGDAAEAKENLAGSAPVPGGDAGARGKVNGRQRKRKATSSASEPPVLGATNGDANQIPHAGLGGRGAGRKRWRRRTEDGSETVRRCPFYKKIPGTPFAVDAFQYGAIEGISAYFLTHFHSDHYNGLRKSSSLPIYCNRITGNLVKSKLRVEEQYIHILPMNTECTVEGVRVTLLEANHCPGAAMLLFLLPDGQTVLHTGDFRADPSMESYPELLACRVQTLYLDTTYCSPEYTFPTQQEAITLAVNRAFEHVALNPRTLVVCGTYSVGKEKVFLAIAEVLGCKVSLSRDKHGTMCCLESERICQLITTDWKAAQVHVLPMMQVNFKNLEAHLSKYSAKYDQVLAFKPTGWTYSSQTEVVQDIQPDIRGNISIYGIPYSEHSSYLEMKRFVQWLRPLKIIPTVNVGSWESRKAMERLFSEWRAEIADRPANGPAAK
ncbi:DNA cross-link repair 1A protein [Conger conger]|uniref:DNA cross-link repair 1A protein n=1 Tax=Conger conger TaxID=82655 RepID=UPI002A5A570F|nr:DNA cross-link repair 1A protein [Conger conger]